VRLLLENGADPAIPNKSGKTALEVAVEEGHDAPADVIRSFRIRGKK
jgi:ankyrin repeat protein